MTEPQLGCRGSSEIHKDRLLFQVAAYFKTKYKHVLNNPMTFTVCTFLFQRNSRKPCQASDQDVFKVRSHRRWESDRG